MEATPQSVLRHHFTEYAQRHPQPLHKHKAVQSVIQCRTAALGGHRQSCPDGHIEKICYNSCKHRCCPKCSALPTERWLDAQKAKLLDCDHYHAIFTLPHQLLELWCYNHRLMADLLFRTATATLTELLGDKKYLGAQVGILASLHTWGRNLSRHPHLHCLITGGGTGADGQWIPANNGYLLPFQVVRVLFRGKFVDALRQAFHGGELKLPSNLNERQFQNGLNRLGRKIKWNVHIRERYAQGHGVATYLARYIKGGPLRHRGQIHVHDHEIMLQYTDHRDRQSKAVRFSAAHFLARWLWHIPEPRQHGVRHYGLYHPRQKETRAQCRTAFGQPPEPEVVVLDWQRYWQRLGKAEKSQCPVCGQPLRVTALLPRSQGPPRSPTRAVTA